MKSWEEILHILTEKYMASGYDYPDAVTMARMQVNSKEERHYLRTSYGVFDAPLQGRCRGMTPNQAAFLKKQARRVLTEKEMEPAEKPQIPIQTDAQLEAWGRQHLPLDKAPVLVKHDSAKPRLSLLNLPFLEEVAHVMDHGAKKYGLDNYMGADPDPVNRFVSAAMRHLWAFLDGEVLDPDSGLPHLAHAAANAMILHRRQMAGINVPQVNEVGELLGELYQQHMPQSSTGKDYDVDK